MSEQIALEGPIPFSQFQEHALYHPRGGFYATSGRAGRGGDFITSPEVGGLFAIVLAGAIDEWWRGLGCPDPFHVIEAGAGTGTLAAGILESRLDCASALQYATVERSATMRGEQTGRLPLHRPNAQTRRYEGLASGAKSPEVKSLDDLPSERIVGLVIANELLDNLPVDLYERRSGKWFEVKVGLAKHGGFEEVSVALQESDHVAGRLRELVPEGLETVRVPLQSATAEWLERALAIVEVGKVIVFDYVRTTPWMASHAWEEWMRTYRGHSLGGSPTDAPGTQDITCEVALDQLSRVKPPNRNRSQAEFLEAHGLLELVREAREVWHARSGFGDLLSIKARARVQEGRVLTDAGGLGRHRVLEWDIPDSE